MRALLGILILGGLFLAAASWQRSQTQSLRAQRRAEFGLPTGADEVHADEEWSVLVLGRPSGAPPLPRPERLEGASTSPADDAPPGVGGRATGSENAYAPDFSYEVRSGDVLGVICSQHYGTAKPALVEAVARYNGLASPDSIRAGDRLLLPDRDLLGR